MEAGTSTARTDIFDRIGDFVGDRVREGVERFVDHATVLSPGIAIARGITDPDGARDSFRRVGNAAYDAASFLVPGVGLARWLTGTSEGRRVARAGAEAVQEGAKGAVDIATVTSPLVAAGRVIVDPDGTKESFARAGKAVKDYVESPLTGYGLARRAYEAASERPDAVKKVADIALDVASIANPILAIGRGIASLFD